MKNLEKLATTGLASAILAISGCNTTYNSQRGNLTEIQPEQERYIVNTEGNEFDFRVTYESKEALDAMKRAEFYIARIQERTPQDLEGEKFPDILLYLGKNNSPNMITEKIASAFEKAAYNCLNETPEDLSRELRRKLEEARHEQKSSP